MKWKDVNIGDIILIRYNTDIPIREVKVIGFSPSQRYVKVSYTDIEYFVSEWIDTNEYDVLEKLNVSKSALDSK